MLNSSVVPQPAPKKTLATMMAEAHEMCVICSMEERLEPQLSLYRRYVDAGGKLADLLNPPLEAFVEYMLARDSKDASVAVTADYWLEQFKLLRKAGSPSPRPRHHLAFFIPNSDSAQPC